MDRLRTLWVALLVGGFLALGCVVGALATHEWVVQKSFNRKVFSTGLWKYCILEKCFTDVATIPAVLASVAAALICLSLGMASMMGHRQRCSPKMCLVPIASLFASAICLLSTIAVTWTELLQRSYGNIYEDLIHMLPSVRANLGAMGITHLSSASETCDAVVSAVKNLNSNSWNKIDVGDVVSFEHGFSSILLISALPLLIICLLIATFIAAFRSAEAEVSQRHPVTVIANQYTIPRH